MRLGNPAINSVAFPGTNVSHYWSATNYTVNNNFRAGDVDLFGGHVIWNFTYEEARVLSFR